MSTQIQDVRRPSAEKSFKIISSAPEDVDIMSLMALTFGIMGLMLKVLF
jgi:hypothetical protein